MKKLGFICLFFLLSIALCATNAFALELDPPEPRQIELGDGLVFFVTPLEYEAMGYPTSGLYQDGELIYTIDREEFWDPVFFSNDGMSFLELPWEWWGERTVIRFYQQGILAQRHYVRYLFTDEGDSLPIPEFTGPAWQIPDRRYYDRANNILRITTVEGSEVTFDLSTGLITDLAWAEPEIHEHNYVHIVIAAIGIVLSTITVLIVLRLKRLRSQ